MNKYSLLSYSFLHMLMLLVIVGCDIEDDPIASTCGNAIIIDRDLFFDGPKDQIVINSAEIDADCLNVNFSASGCDGLSWELDLLSTGDVLESLPPQMGIRLSLNNSEDCTAYITNDINFDITFMRVEGGKVLFNLDNFNQQISYEY